MLPRATGQTDLTRPTYFPDALALHSGYGLSTTASVDVLPSAYLLPFRGQKAE
jgi:hypothetical protein